MPTFTTLNISVSKFFNRHNNKTVCSQKPKMGLLKQLSYYLFLIRFDAILETQS
jgi:hypothetical protein